MELGAGSGASERTAVLQPPAAHRRVKTEPGLEEESATEHFRMKQDSTYVPAGVCSPDAACAVKQEMDVGPTVLQPTDLQDMMVQPKLEPVKEEPLQVDINSSASMCGEAAISSNNMSKRHGGVLSNLQVKNEQPSDVCSGILPENTSIPDFKCDLCMKSFRQKSYLKTHMLTHTGIRSFECDLCMKLFGQKSNLNTHMLTHTGIRNFQCDLCMRSFGKRSNLKTHMLTHTGIHNFKCDVCFKSFKLKYGLNRHMKTHTGILPFKCYLCMEQFARKKNLQSHLVLHRRYK